MCAELAGVIWATLRVMMGRLRKVTQPMHEDNHPETSLAADPVEVLALLQRSIMSFLRTRRSSRGATTSKRCLSGLMKRGQPTMESVAVGTHGGSGAREETWGTTRATPKSKSFNTQPSTTT